MSKKLIIIYFVGILFILSGCVGKKSLRMSKLFLLGH